MSDDLDPRARRLLDELRATEERAEPDWAALQARIGAALDREPSPRRRARWRWAAVGGAALVATAAAILLISGARHSRPRPEPPLTEADLEMVEELDTPDDLGGMTLDDDLLDEAAALYADEDI